MNSLHYAAATAAEYPPNQRNDEPSNRVAPRSRVDEAFDELFGRLEYSAKLSNDLRRKLGPVLEVTPTKGGPETGAPAKGHSILNSIHVAVRIIEGQNADKEMLLQELVI